MIALISMALAVTLTSQTVTCPLGGGQVKVFQKLGEDRTGGYDSDFAAYSASGQWRGYAIATCDGNLLSLFGTDMMQPLPPDKGAAVDAALRKAVAAVADKANPTVWERYQIAAAVYAALGKDERFLGDLLLQASWTARDEIVGYYASLNGPVVQRQLLDAGQGELQKDLSVENRKKVLYNLAKVAHRGGWTVEQNDFLAKFEALGLDERERTAVAKFRRIATQVEPMLQQQVLSYYATALSKGKLAPEEVDRLTYTSADLNRRLGHWDLALAGYKKVLASEASDELVNFSRWFVEQGK